MKRYNQIADKPNRWEDLVTTILRALCAVSVLALAVPAAAQNFPNKPIRMVVGFGPGGGSDISARILSELLAKRLGQPVVVENKPGAASMIGVDFVAKSPADGYTLSHTNSDGTTMMVAVRKNVPYAVPKDFTFIAQILQAPLVVAVSSNLPVNTMAELISYAKSNPGKLRYGTSGIGTGPHLSTLLFEKHAGIKMAHVPYKGSGPAITDLAGGHIDLSLPALSGVMAHVASGKVKLLAVTSPTRDPAIPNVPTMKEVGLPDVTIGIWYGILGPAGMPADVTDRLRKEVVDALNSAEAKQRYKAAGFELSPLAGAEFEKAVATESKIWKDLAEAEKIVVTD
jgi:tripartite-type tricarboxylate transporter receptor subunit TctC